MSDPNSPYGQSPSGPNPYGQTPESPSPYGQAPYGQSPSGQSPYGQEPYGQSPYGTSPAYGAPTGPTKRPGTVTAAAVTTLVTSGLVALLSLIGVIGLLASKDSVLDVIRDEPSLDDFSTAELDSAYVVIVGVFVVLLVWCLIAMLLAVLTMRGSNAARITLVVSASVTALVSLVSIGSLVTVVPLIAAIAVIVLLFVGDANAWFSGRKAAKR